MRNPNRAQNPQCKKRDRQVIAGDWKAVEKLFITICEKIFSAQQSRHWTRHWSELRCNFDPVIERIAQFASRRHFYGISAELLTELLTALLTTLLIFIAKLELIWKPCVLKRHHYR
jgi:hypothetical protein